MDRSRMVSEERSRASLRSCSNTVGMVSQWSALIEKILSSGRKSIFESKLEVNLRLMDWSPS